MNACLVPLRSCVSVALLLTLPVIVPIASARDKPARGEVEAAIAADGHPKSCTLLTSSGDKALDTAAVERCKGMNFPTPTGSYQPAQDKVTVILPVRPTPSQ